MKRELHGLWAHCSRRSHIAPAHWVQAKRVNDPATILPWAPYRSGTVLSFETEVHLIRKGFGDANFNIVYPPISILAENLVAIVDEVVCQKGTRAVAQAYLKNLC
jgi:hypothetical protein